MKDVSVNDKKNKFGLKSKIVLGALVLAALVVFTAVARAQATPKDKDAEDATERLLLFRQVRIFNPFTLTSSNIRDTLSENPVNSVSVASAAGRPKRPPIRIPFRPVPRSPCRPPWPWP